MLELITAAAIALTAPTGSSELYHRNVPMREEREFKLPVLDVLKVRQGDNYPPALSAPRDKRETIVRYSKIRF